MKKILIFLILGFNIYAVDGNIGLIGQISQERYEDKISLDPLPFIILRGENFSLEGVNLKARTNIYDSEMYLAFEPSLGMILLDEGDLDGKILTQREKKEVLKFEFSKKGLLDITYNVNLKKEFKSRGNIVEIGASYIYFLVFKHTYVLIPEISFSYGDSNYANYYYNFTKKESENLDQDYNSLKGSKRISLGLTTNMVLNESLNLMVKINSELIDKNIITNKENEIKSSFGLGISYSFN